MGQTSTSLQDSIPFSYPNCLPSSPFFSPIQNIPSAPILIPTYLPPYIKALIINSSLSNTLLYRPHSHFSSSEYQCIDIDIYLQVAICNEQKTKYNMNECWGNFFSLSIYLSIYSFFFFSFFSSYNSFPKHAHDVYEIQNRNSINHSSSPFKWLLQRSPPNIHIYICIQYPKL